MWNRGSREKGAEHYSKGFPHLVLKFPRGVFGFFDLASLSANGGKLTRPNKITSDLSKG
jgi:hypothetical protein